MCVILSPNISSIPQTICVCCHVHCFWLADVVPLVYEKLNPQSQSDTDTLISSRAHAQQKPIRARHSKYFTVFQSEDLVFFLAHIFCAYLLRFAMVWSDSIDVGRALSNQLYHCLRLLSGTNYPTLMVIFSRYLEF